MSSLVHEYSRNNAYLLKQVKDVFAQAILACIPDDDKSRTMALVEDYLRCLFVMGLSTLSPITLPLLCSWMGVVKIWKIHASKEPENYKNLCMMLCGKEISLATAPGRNPLDLASVVPVFLPCEELPPDFITPQKALRGVQLSNDKMKDALLENEKLQKMMETLQMEFKGIILFLGLYGLVFL
jgi:hypothetical protein